VGAGRRGRGGSGLRALGGVPALPGLPGGGRARGGEAAALAELESYRARGLWGPPPGRPLPDPPAIGEEERRRLAEAFSCPHCGGRELDGGDPIVRHACPGESPRPVAWRGYDGALVELSWWRQR
jgi:hypothetical protein